MSTRTPPTLALALGTGGLLPFAGLALAHALALDASLGLGAGTARTALVFYAVAILSFLGGVRWGLALGAGEPERRDRLLLTAVIPALVAWGAALLPRPLDLAGLVVAFAALGVADVSSAWRGDAPEWYARLRVGLTLGVLAALGLALLSRG